MNTVLYLIKKIDCAHDKKVVAVCSTKKKAQSMLKELVDDPSCSQPLRENFELEDEYAHIENVHGWWADYRIEEILMDEWID